MRCIMIMLALACNSARGDVWTPPENPDPKAILLEAHADTLAKRYETALAKHIWFHKNAVKINPGMSGVRLSFALSYWKNLGQDYPPAVEKLQRIRDELEAKAKERGDIGSGFHDLVAINKTLGEDSRNTDAFKSLIAKNPEAAKRAFVFVKSALIKDKKYALYAEYVQPRRDFLQMKQLFETNVEMAKDPKFGTRFLDHANRSFRNSSATLVAILSVNDRKAEATEIASLAKNELEDAQFHKELESALAGTVPDPWP